MLPRKASPVLPSKSSKGGNQALCSLTPCLQPSIDLVYLKLSPPAVTVQPGHGSMLSILLLPAAAPRRSWSEQHCGSAKASTNYTPFPLILFVLASLPIPAFLLLLLRIIFLELSLCLMSWDRAGERALGKLR